MDDLTRADAVLSMLSGVGDYAHSSDVCCSCGEERGIRPWAGAAFDPAGRQRGICNRCLRGHAPMVNMHTVIKSYLNQIRHGWL